MVNVLERLARGLTVALLCCAVACASDSDPRCDLPFLSLSSSAASRNMAISLATARHIFEVEVSQNVPDPLSTIKRPIFIVSLCNLSTPMAILRATSYATRNLLQRFSECTLPATAILCRFLDNASECPVCFDTIIGRVTLNGTPWFTLGSTALPSRAQDGGNSTAQLTMSLRQLCPGGGRQSNSHGSGGALDLSVSAPNDREVVVAHAGFCETPAPPPTPFGNRDQRSYLGEYIIATVLLVLAVGLAVVFKSMRESIYQRLRYKGR